MATEIETSVAQVGLRDFLFYVVPGAVVLAGILALEGVGARDLQPYLGVSSSIAAILASYILGQCTYPVAYIFRKAMDKWGRLRRLPGEGEEIFEEEYRKVSKDNPTYFAVEVFRYRTMARFCSVMVFPVLFAAAGIAWGAWRLHREESAAVFITASLVCLGFLWRYYRYECRYRSSLVKAKQEITASSSTEETALVEVERSTAAQSSSLAADG